MSTIFAVLLAVVAVNAWGFVAAKLAVWGMKVHA